jgi:hypothetical protein
MAQKITRFTFELPTVYLKMLKAIAAEREISVKEIILESLRETCFGQNFIDAMKKFVEESECQK